MVRSLVTKDMQICPQERTMSTMKTKTSSFDNKSVLNFKQKHRKAEKSITSEQEPITRLIYGPGDLVTHTGELAGDQFLFRETP